MVTRRWLAVLPVVLLVGCYQPSPPNGALLCSLDRECPTGYHCAVDGACWRDGSDPDPFDVAPVPISPRNGAVTGSVRAALSRRPLFRSTTLAGATSYEVQLDDTCDPVEFRSCGFPSPEATETGVSPSLRLSSGLNLPTTTPAGRRYYWRMRGCMASRCTPWSEVRYLDVGRSLTDFTGDGETDLEIGNANASINGVAAVGTGYTIAGAGGAFPSEHRPGGGAFADHYGISAISAGDVDGDGFADLAVGEEGPSQFGTVYLYRGGMVWPQSTPSQTLRNPSGHTSALYASALAAGDLNGDGHSDLVVGAYGQKGAELAEGKVFIYAGNASPNGLQIVPSWILTNPGHQNNAEFGRSLAVGDFNGDGYPDVAVGAPSVDQVGRVFVHNGGPRGPVSPASVQLDAPVIVTRARFGSAMVTGDFNGDGYSDLVVAASEEMIGGQQAVGRVYVYVGGPTGITDRTNPRQAIDNPANQMGSFFGWALAAADFNADDIDDLVVSATYHDIAAGRVYVYAGAPAGVPATPSRTLVDPPPVNNNDFFGYVLGVGDRGPADGFADLFVGATRDSGMIYLFNGNGAGVPEMPSSAITGQMVPGGDLGPSCLSSASP
jgi:FG-GAP repeat/FG-GAP-like repeat